MLCLAITAIWADDPKATLQAAQEALSAGDYARALERAQEAGSAFHSNRDPSHEKLSANIAGAAHLYRGEYDAALERYQAALAIDRRQHDAAGEITRLTNIGSVYFYRGRYSKALAEYQTALARTRETGAGSQLVYTNLATLYEQLGDTRQALEYYEKALAQGTNADLLTNSASLYRRLGDPRKAIATYRDAGTLYQSQHQTREQAHVLEEIGVTQALALKDLNTALSSFTEALALDPGALIYRGEALYRLGRAHEAEADFRAAGNNWIALYRLGCLDDKNALSYFTQALGNAGGSAAGEFLPRKRDLYDATIRLLLRAKTTDLGRLFALYELAHGSPNPPASLQSVQARLAAGSLLVEYWDNSNLLWATRNQAGLGDIPATGFHQFLVVAESPGLALPEGHPVSYLPYASLLTRDEPWRTPILPWRTRTQTIRDVRNLYTGAAPVVFFNTFAASAEIQSLPLSRTDLVVLSAPDADLAASRAFLAAGARSTLAPLRATPQAGAFQQRFLAEVQAGRTKSEALQAAKAADPATGASFVLVGDGQQPARPVLSWWWIIAAGIVISGVILIRVRR